MKPRDKVTIIADGEWATGFIAGITTILPNQTYYSVLIPNMGIYWVLEYQLTKDCTKEST